MGIVETPNGYVVIERIGGLDVYMDSCLVCELCGDTMANYSYDEKIDFNKLDEAIEEELGTLDLLEKVTDPFNFI